MYFTNNQLLDKLKHGWKKIQNSRFIAIFRILSQWFDFVGAIT